MAKVSVYPAQVSVFYELKKIFIRMIDLEIAIKDGREDAAVKYEVEV